MRFLPFSLILLTMLLLASGCAGSMGTAVPTEPMERLQYDLDAVLTDSIFTSTMPSLRVVDPTTGRVLYDRNSEYYIRPASNMKILTSSTALHVLGTRYRFKTSVAWDAEPTGQTLNGNLYLKGYGNPDLRTADLDSLAQTFAGTGVTHVTGNLIVDASFLDSLQWGIGWMWDDEPSPYQAYVSALSVNKNCIRVIVAPDTVTGGVSVTTEPATAYVRIVNNASIAQDSIAERLSISRPATEPPNTIVIEGQIWPTDEPYEEELTILWPDLYAGTLLKEALAHHGVQVDGAVASGPLPKGVTEKLWHTWGIDSMVINLMKVSDNLSAEMTLKTVGATVFGPPGAIRSGRTAANQFFSALGIDTTRHRMADGSGLSHYSLLRVGLLTDILVAMYHQKDIFPLFYEAMPIGGVDGTLEGRMMGTRAEGNVRAKTGTISGVSSLSGYVTDLDGDMLVFGMTTQDFIGSSGPFRRAQDKVCAILADFTRRATTAR